MPYLQLNDRRLTLRVGEMRIGAGSEADLSVSPAPTAAEASRLDATVVLAGDGVTSIRRGTNGTAVRVNGVPLGVEPTPLIHGDKIEVGTSTLVFGDDQKSGSTQFVQVSELEKLRAKTPPKAANPNASGGRVISLVDGREYQVNANGLTFGRDVKCDVVMPSSDVSRRHAQIEATDTGYVITDMSSNGVFVNGKRIDGTQKLKRSDVIRMGTEEFRFYADVNPNVVAASSAPTVVAPVTPQAPRKTPIASTPHLAGPSVPGPSRAGLPRETPPAEAAERGSGAWFWFAATVLVAIVIYIVLKGH